MSLLACGGMLACTNEDVTGENNGQGEGTEVSYLAVNIMNAGGPMTRVDDYVDGKGDESKIGNVRFYLFTSSGAAYNCFTGGVNYTDVDPNPNFTDQTDGNNVEKISDAVLVIPNGVQGQLPGKMVTVINDKTASTSMTLDNLKKQIANFGATGENQFVMSNSTYVDGSKVVCETDLTLNDFATTAEAAKLAPVEVYVERVVAKVTPNITMTSTTTTGGSEKIYKVYDDTDDTKDVYIKINGWALADKSSTSYLCKQLSSSYTDLGITDWTSASNHRSFWANSVAFGTDNTKQNQAWTGITTTLNGTTSLYTQENTPTAVVSFLKNENDLTKFILAATLVNNTGTAITRITHRGVEYTDKDGLLTQIAQYPQTTDNTPYYVSDGGSYRMISKDDVEFKTATDLGTTGTGLDSYRVYVQLKNTVTALYNSTGSEITGGVNTYNTALRTQANSAMIWESGKTYYYTAIPHLGSDGKLGQYGVVRNHVYQINITEIKGFGTPVYDSDETIIPVTPADDASYLAAKINVLAWKIVSKDVTLGE